MRSTLVLAVLLAGCFFKKEIPERQPDLLQGGTLMLEQCGYEVKTVDGASRPELGEAMLGADPTPRFVHLHVGPDPKSNIAILWRTKDEDTLATTVQYGKNGMTDKSQRGVTYYYDSAMSGRIRMHETHLCGLEPDTEYSYRVGGAANGTESWSPVYKFRTAPDRSKSPDAEVEVLVIGDTRDGY